jgi:hypothetical protein
VVADTTRSFPEQDQGQVRGCSASVVRPWRLRLRNTLVMFVREGG